MKLSTKIMMSALAVMFVVSTPAEAQFGSLIRGARLRRRKEKKLLQRRHSANVTLCRQ